MQFGTPPRIPVNITGRSDSNRLGIKNRVFAPNFVHTILLSAVGARTYVRHVTNAGNV